MKSLWWHIKLLRPLNLLTGAFSMVVSAGILNRMYDVQTLILTICVVVCYNAAANAYNDVEDYKTDTVNRPNRPLVKGYVKIKTATVMSVIFCSREHMCSLASHYGSIDCHRFIHAHHDYLQQEVEKNASFWKCCSRIDFGFGVHFCRGSL